MEFYLAKPLPSTNQFEKYGETLMRTYAADVFCLPQKNVFGSSF